MKRMRWAGRDFIGLAAESEPGRPAAEQLAGLLERLDRTLGGFGLRLENAVRHRLWTRDRRAREESNDMRSKLVSGARRCATSSFIDRERFSSAGDIALELLVQCPSAENHRRLVEFDPPRRYARYLVQDGVFHLAGMAEPGATIEAQFDNAFGEVTRSMMMEGIGWADVLSASLFIERGRGEPQWLMERFRGAAGTELPHVTCAPVDGLAATDKHLEIEITARLPAR